MKRKLFLLTTAACLAVLGTATLAEDASTAAPIEHNIVTRVGSSPAATALDPVAATPQDGAFGTSLIYRPMSVEDYATDRTAELGEFMGPIIAGIYQGIRDGALDNPSDFENTAGRPHQSWDDIFTARKNKHGGSEALPRFTGN